ncbi:MAG: DUF885 domain-containing protein [Thermoflexibacter sp.]|nr:DUF885 domain-containing protein [Thermoflexibacter sp.]
MKHLTLSFLLLNLILFLIIQSCSPKQEPKQATDKINLSPAQYQDLVNLFKEWRAFEKPPLREGAPDYTMATFGKRLPKFKELQAKLLSMDTARWTVEQRVDWCIVKAEMNGFDFNYRVLQPWARDPAFYKSFWTERSDVPAHEGPTHHATTEIWTYNFPLSPSEKARLLNDLKVIPPLNSQAKLNLTGNAKDLWNTGIRDIRSQSEDLKHLLEQNDIKQDTELAEAIQVAIQSTDDLANWLEQEGKKKTGESGIGKENYTWYQQNVHLVPLTWEEEVLLLKRELARAWSALKLEEHKNRNLPPLIDADSPEAYQKLAEKSAKSLLSFLDKEEIVSVKDYFYPALQAHLGKFVPKEKRHFFWITAHYDPRPLYSHFYHWFELAQMDLSPHASEIRRSPLLYNIFDSHNEGIATGVEETFMHVGLYEDNPHAREIVYIMLAQRAARGLGSLYAHANEMTMEEAGKIHSEYTPRGWMKTEKELRIFEQHLYMRQPGYGTSYITGKYLIESNIADFARMKELNKEPFRIKDFLDKLNEIGNIPAILGHWQMTGNDDALRLINQRNQ